MNVRAISLSNVFGHAFSVVRLPATGIVTVTGPNGAGKSGLFMEGVAAALWGKTLRGTPPWSDAAAGEARAGACLDGLEIERVRSRNKTSLYWRPVDDGTETGRAFDARVRLGELPEVSTDSPRFETASKAQEALDSLIEPFDVWRRTCALSSADAAHFSLATDAERKRLLESILGLERFDRALEECRADAAKAADRLRARERDLALAEQTLGAEEGELRRLSRELEALAADAPPALPLPDGPSAAELTKLARDAGARVADLRAKYTELEERLRELSRAGGAADAEARQRKAQADRLSASPECPTCGQRIAPAHLHSLQGIAAAHAETARREREAVAAALEGAQDVLRLVTAERAEAEEEARAFDRRRADRLVVESAAATREAERARWAGARTRLADAAGLAAGRVESARTGLADARNRLTLAQREIDTLRAVEGVVGLKGVRVQLLAHALGGVETVANAWLARLGLPGLGLRLRPYTEKKTGGQSDAIGLEVAGAGGGHGYRAASAGERRRIDIAILLALSEVAAAARGAEPGTLFFDELFDALDGEGVEACAAVLGELAQARCVVVITHNPELVAALPAVKRFHVEGGAVT